MMKLQQLQQPRAGALRRGPARRMVMPVAQAGRDVKAGAAADQLAAPTEAKAASGCPVTALKNLVGIQPIDRKPLAKVRVLPDGEVSSLPLPPGPAFMLPLLGETSDYSNKGPLKFGLERHAKYGPVFKTSLWGNETYMTTDMNITKAFMLEDTKAHNFNTFGTFGKVLGDFATEVLSNKDGARMPQRRSMMAALSTECLQGYAIKIADIAEKELAHLATVDKWELNEESRKLGMSFANSLLAGLEGLSPEDEKSIRDNLATMFDGLITFDIDLPGSPLRKALDARAFLLERIEKSIQAQIDEISKEKEPVIPGSRPRKNMLGYMIDDKRSRGEAMSPARMSSLALGVLQAGTDTSSSGFNASFVMVAQLPHVMEAIREEQRRVVAQHGPVLNKQSLDASVYLDAVVKEVLRIHAVAAVQFRLTFKEMEVAGYRIPKGSSFFMNVMTGHTLELQPDWPAGEADIDKLPTHMDKMQLEQSFRPERWLDEATRPNILTFGHGPHTCVGMALYYMEAKALLATIARKYSLELLADKVEWQEFPIVRPMGDVYLRTKPLPASEALA